MSYFFPHATREATRQKTVNDFEKHCQIAIDIRDRLLSEFIEYVPLFDKLVAIKREKVNLTGDMKSGRIFMPKMLD